MPAQLDFALVAQFAKLEPGGLLTVVGATVDGIGTEEVPTQAALTVVVRILVGQEERSAAVPVALSFRGPSGDSLITLSTEFTPEPDLRPVAGQVGAILIANAMLPLPEYGSYELQVRLSDELVKSLPLDVTPIVHDPSPGT